MVTLKSAIIKPIVLVGMMGTGKSTIGRKLANKLNLQFYDSDKIIEERQGLSVRDIHDFRGEEFFQNLELEVITEVLKYGVIVLSTGGESFLIEEVRKTIKERATSIWLDTSADVIHERVSRRNTRPLLDGNNKIEHIEQMLDERNNFYSESDIRVETGNMEAHFVVDSILSKLKKYFGE